MESFSLLKPDDWHIHLRDNEYLLQTVKDASRYLSRAIIMPNLKPPVTTVAKAKAYHDRITKHIPANKHFKPLMTLYLTENTTHEDIINAAKSSFIVSCKLYPAGVTTNSQSGVSDISILYPVFEAMQDNQLILNIHGECSHPSTDIFAREARFIEDTLVPLCKQFPKLRIVLEHVSTRIGVEFVLAQDANVAATITPQHLLFNRNDLLSGGIKPHLYCLPILKKQTDQEAIIKAAISGNPKIFMGTDSAPHAKTNKETACGCAGVYSAHASIEIYTGIFERYDSLDKLEAFTSINGANFYQLPLNKDKIELVKSPWKVPDVFSFGKEQLVPLYAGKTLNWQVK